MSWRDLWKTFWKCLEDVFARCLEDILKTSWRYVLKTFSQDVLKKSWKRLEDVLKTYGQDECIGLDKDVLKTSSEDVWVRWLYSSWSRRLKDVFIKTNVCWVRSLLVRIISNNVLATKMPKKLYLYVYLFEEWVHIEETLTKLNICLFW